MVDNVFLLPVIPSKQIEFGGQRFTFARPTRLEVGVQNLFRPLDHR